MDDRSTRVPGVTSGGDKAGTSLVGYLSASYGELVALFGPPDPGAPDDYKVSTEWVLTFEGATFTLYDYKETDMYQEGLPSIDTFRHLPSYDWHVGAVNDGHGMPVPSVVFRFLDVVQTALWEVR